MATQFQSTHPHGVRPHLIPDSTLIWLSFNPRTHTGCDNLYRFRQTLSGSFNPRTHTGCDFVEFLREYKGIRFQSTHPHGVRLPPEAVLVPRDRVSIHAPTRGATVPLSCPHSRPACFNPRTHTGCDPASCP